MSQEEYSQHFRTYSNATQKVRNFVDAHRPEVTNEPITDPLTAMGTIAKCSTCEGAVLYAQK